ncbi:molybdenum cofactor biosynthesis protein MoaE [Niabella sp. CC-SYL272]|uniref:molybdenum cofactor biosynthesis protein MoaE n=1 Tax=Niabella agricola TaxID=2891571 RepID=UPI001F462EDE|nr:molybdenum cofactor biosynthesis protein MoaE [Niabella agricola]MCF3110648.1 molybdenum cofactor biosynthesis protein MoaE [Niabella agricola]
MIEIKISGTTLNVLACMDATADDTCGGLVTFTGIVRNKTKEKTVTRLEYECYEPMALKEMQKIAENAIRLFAVKNVCIHHRTGVLGVGDIAVIIAVNAPHREAAFDACRYAIDTLKQKVPIWKKEVFEDGEEWVAAHA